MPDNVTIGGKTIAADEVVIDGAPALVGRDKIGFGSPGSHVDVDASNPLPVGDASAQAKLDTLAARLFLEGSSEDVATILAAIRTLLGGTLVAKEAGTFGYAGGTAPATVDVPTGARVKRVSVLPGVTAATVTIAGGPTITIPAGGGFDERIPGDAALGGDVVIGGAVSSYYVGWVS